MHLHTRERSEIICRDFRALTLSKQRTPTHDVTFYLHTQPAPTIKQHQRSLMLPNSRTLPTLWISRQSNFSTRATHGTPWWNEQRADGLFISFPLSKAKTEHLPTNSISESTRLTRDHQSPRLRDRAFLSVYQKRPSGHVRGRRLRDIPRSQSNQGIAGGNLRLGRLLSFFPLPSLSLQLFVLHRRTNQPAIVGRFCVASSRDETASIF